MNNLRRGRPIKELIPNIIPEQYTNRDDVYEEYSEEVLSLLRSEFGRKRPTHTTIRFLRIHEYHRLLSLLGLIAGEEKDAVISEMENRIQSMENRKERLVCKIEKMSLQQAELKGAINKILNKNSD